MPLVTGQTREQRRAGREAGTQTSLLGALLGGVLGRGRQGAPQASATGTPGPTGAEQRLEPAQEGISELEAAGEEHLEGERDVIARNKAEAEALARRQRTGQRQARERIGVSDRAAEAGLDEVRGTIEETREELAKMPEQVQGEFDRQQTRIDAGLEEARTGLAEQRTEALGNVMQSQSMVMEAAVSGIHGGIRQQVSQIDAQVQQGIISPSQATMMKSQIRMGGAMQLSAAVGQTAHLFTQTQAQVATSFGTMFTQFESTAAQVQGQFGATAASAFGQAQTAAAQLNTQLTSLDVQATAHRDTILSQNAATRATFQNMNDQNNMAMLDYTQDTYVSGYPMAINNLEAQWRMAGDLIKSDEFKATMELLERNMQLTNQGNMFNMFASVIGMIGG